MGIGFAGAADVEKRRGLWLSPAFSIPTAFLWRRPKNAPASFSPNIPGKNAEMSRVNAKKFEIFFHRAAMASRKSISDVFQPKILRG